MIGVSFATPHRITPTSQGKTEAMTRNQLTRSTADRSNDRSSTDRSATYGAAKRGRTGEGRRNQGQTSWGRSSNFTRRYSRPRRHDPAVRWTTSVVRRSLRRPLVWWFIVALAAAATGWSVNREYVRAVDAQLAWGEPVRVVVAAKDIDVGESIDGAADLEAWPSALVPANALRSIDSNDVARVRLVTGELIIAERVSSGPAGGLVDLLPEGTVAVAVPVGPGAPPVSVGDRVDLHATFNRGGGAQTAGTDTQQVATGSVVVDLTDDAITVAIDKEEVAATASALSRASVTVALTGR